MNSTEDFTGQLIRAAERAEAVVFEADGSTDAEGLARLAGAE